MKKITLLTITTLFSLNVLSNDTKINDNDWQENYKLIQKEGYLDSLSNEQVKDIYNKSLSNLYCVTDHIDDMQDENDSNNHYYDFKTAIDYTNNINKCLSLPIVDNLNDNKSLSNDCWNTSFKKFNSFYGYFKNELLETNSFNESNFSKEKYDKAIKLNYNFLEYTKDFSIDYKHCFSN